MWINFSDFYNFLANLQNYVLFLRNKSTQIFSVDLGFRMQTVSCFCIFSLKIIEFFVRGSIFFIFKEQILPNKDLNRKNKFRKNFFRKNFRKFFPLRHLAAAKITPHEIWQNLHLKNRSLRQLTPFRIMFLVYLLKQ